MHHRDPFDGGYRRVMHRIQCAGDLPVFRPDGREGYSWAGKPLKSGKKSL